MTDAEVIAELQAGNKLLKRQRYALKEKVASLQVEKARLREELAKCETIMVEETRKID